MQRLEVSGAVRPIYGSLDVKRLRRSWIKTFSAFSSPVDPRATEDRTNKHYTHYSVSAGKNRFDLLLRSGFIRIPPPKKINKYKIMIVIIIYMCRFTQNNFGNIFIII